MTDSNKQIPKTMKYIMERSGTAIAKQKTFIASGYSGYLLRLKMRRT